MATILENDFFVVSRGKELDTDSNMGGIMFIGENGPWQSPVEKPKKYDASWDGFIFRAVAIDEYSNLVLGQCVYQNPNLMAIDLVGIVYQFSLNQVQLSPVDKSYAAKAVALRQNNMGFGSTTNQSFSGMIINPTQACPNRKTKRRNNLE